MPPRVKGEGVAPFCMICSLDFHDWIALQPGQMDFRALYRGLDGVKLTGIGSSKHYKGFRAPNDEEARWNTMGDDSILLLNPQCWISDVYFFHEKCWNLLLEHISRAEFDLESLYEALECFPPPEEPWEFQCFEDNVAYDIFTLPTLEQLLQLPKPSPAPPGHISKKLKGAHKNPMDCFNSLPLEILEAIAIELPTRDALSLRHASRAMVWIFASKAFWKTRFSINCERGFLHQVVRNAKGKKGKEIDWRLLYHCTCKLKCSPEFEFQIRIWESLRWLRDMTLAKCSKRSAEDKNCLHLQHGMPLHFRGRALQHYHNTCYPNTHIESVDISQSLSAISISAVQINTEVHITGIEFTFNDRPTALIGYKTPGAKIINRDAMNPDEKSQYKYPGIRFETDISHLRGFSANTLFDGIHLIKIIQDPDIEDYVGYTCHYDGGRLHNESYLCLDEIRRVIGTFDHCKMLDLGILGIATKGDDGVDGDFWHDKVVPYYQKIVFKLLSDSQTT